MILVDKDIRERVARQELIVSGYKEENLNGVSYDLTVDYVRDAKGEEQRNFELHPGEVVFVKTQEKLSIPLDILGRIAEKNSRMRQGIKVDGPHYQPGHVTYAYLRVQNISEDIIELSRGMKIAQIIFEQLSQVPDVPYSRQEGASFQNEEQYFGLGNYKAEYEKQTRKKVEETKEDIESMSQRIYGNVLTIMGVLVAVFSLLTINYQAFINANIDTKYIIAMNLTLALCIVLMMGIILLFVNKARSRKIEYIYIAVLTVLAVATIIMAFCV
jgi:deoxycytidine triphosphate deaminase